MKKWVFIMRGCPGSGKSTIANCITGVHGGVIHTTDSYHMEGGKYVFKPEKLAEFHEKNLEAFKESLKKGIEVVICDNTNISPSHWSDYEHAARVAKYSVRIITVTGGSSSEYEKNTCHSVPLQVIDRMRCDLYPLGEK